MRLIKNYKNRHDGKHSDDDNVRIKSMELRLSVRKGNAQAKLGKSSEAIAEYEKALLLDPSNTSVKKDLDMLRKTVWTTSFNLEFLFLLNKRQFPF